MMHSRIKVFVGLALLAVGLFFGFILVIRIIQSRSPLVKAGKELPQVLARAKELGLPLTADDMPKPPTVDPNENAAVDLEELAPLVIKRYSMYRPISIYRDVSKQIGPFSRTRKDFRYSDPTYEELRQQILEAADKRTCQFTIDWDQVPWQMSMTKIDALNAMAKQPFSDLIYMKPKQDIAERLVANLGRQNRLSLGLATIPLGRTLFYALREFHDRGTSISEILKTQADNTALLKRLLVANDDYPIPSNWDDVVKGEFYSALALGRNVTSATAYYRAQEWNGQAPPMPYRIRKEGLPPNPYVRGMVTLQLKSLIRIQEKLNTHPSDVAFFDYVQNDWRREFGRNYHPTESETIIFERFNRIAFERLMAIASQRCLHTLLQTLIFINENRRLPKTITEPGPVGLDPYSGKPLVVRVTSTELTVLSFGKNGIENKLKVTKGPGNSTSYNRGDDVSFTVDLTKLKALHP